MRSQLDIFRDISNDEVKPVINVASVPQRSPFRYPGGKTWLIPLVRLWLKQDNSNKKLIEPFAGGGIVSLTTAFEELAAQILMVEKDEEVAAVWEIILNGKNQWLADKIFSFNLTHDNINIELNRKNKKLQDIAFCTILKNRVYHGGILAKGSGLIKNGENGKGISSRWYPKTLKDRITAINHIKNKITFISGDAFDAIENNLSDEQNFFFIDPPYTIAGRRLYTYFDLDHERLFELTSKISGKYMLTYDDNPYIRALADTYKLQYRTIPMKTTHHIQKNEIIISDNFSWWR